MLFLPPYRLDLNPKNKAFPKLKAHLKKAAMRTFDGIINKIDDICDMFSPHKCWNYFKKAKKQAKHHQSQHHCAVGT